MRYCMPTVPASTEHQMAAPIQNTAELKRSLSAISVSLATLKLQMRLKPNDDQLKQSLKELEDAEALVRKTLRGLV
jgi:hypothetical protein